MISTYLEHPNQIPLLRNYKFQSIIIDLPLCSIRSFKRYPWSIDELKHANEQLNSQYFVLNIDGIYSDDELMIIQSNFDTEFQSIFSGFRIQDPGITQWLKKSFPNAIIQLNSETGNQNSYSLQVLFESGIDQITLNHEIPFPTVQSFSQIHDNLEIFVQGNILIQYSRRQFISDHYDISSDDPISFTSEDDDLPNRKFTFLNTAFGHFMFAHFHRCLAEYPEKLTQLSTLTWLIDSRGQSDDYFEICLKLYSELGSLSKDIIKDYVEKLELISNKPQRPSFFLSNNTDYDWRNYVNDFDKKQAIGRIISVSKLDTICVQFFKEIPLDTIIICHNPDQTFKEFYINEIENLTEPLKLYFMPWKKGIQTKGNLYIKDS